MNMKMRLIVMNFLQFAVWGAYLTSMGTYLADVGLGGHIGIFTPYRGLCPCSCRLCWVLWLTAGFRRNGCWG